MKKYAVAYVSLLGDDLEIKITEAYSWHDALSKTFPEFAGVVNPDNLNKAKKEAFDQDWQLDVVEIKGE